MQVRFVAQPFADGTDLRDFFRAVADDEHLTTVRFAVAWAKRSGLARVSSDLRTIRARGGRVLAVVGVSEGGATEQGMQDLIDLADQPYVYHHPGRTFHPKVYLAEGDDRAVLLVGSQNMTAGGLAWNYEAAVWCDLDLGRDEDRQVRDDVTAYIDRLVADEGACVLLEAQVLERLLADGTLLVQDEGRARRGLPRLEPDHPEDADDVDVEQDAVTDAPVFMISSEPMRSLPALPGSAGKNGRSGSAAVSSGPSGSTTRTAAIDAKRLSWSKTLESTDAQKPPSPRSNPTGNLRLSREQYEIDQTRYFRDVFFSNLKWRSSSKNVAMEEAWFDAAVTVDGQDLGEMTFRVSHLPSRVSSQGNVATVLHWGPLGGLLRARDYRGGSVTLEHTAGAGTRLTLTG